MIAIAVALGAGGFYLAFEEPGERLQSGLNQSSSALVDPADSELAQSAEIFDRQARSVLPGQPDAGPDSNRDLASRRDRDAPDVASETAPSEAADRLAQTDPEEEAGEDAEAPPELAISGAVLDDRGSLLPGVTVEALEVGSPAGSSSQSDSLGRARSTVTDNLGGFVFEPLSNSEYRLSVEGTEEFHGTDLQVRAGVANAELRVQRIRQVRVHGQIIDEHGGALEDVRVRDLGGTHAPPSNVDGAYEIIIEPVKAGQAPVLEFRHPRYRSQRLRVEAIAGSDADSVRLDVEMQPSDEQVAVLGHVSGPQGEPVPNAEVWLSSADPRNYLSTRSNEGGEFVFDQVELGDAYRLGVDPSPDYRKYVSDAFEVGPGNTAHDVRLEDQGLGSLFGRLVDPEGRALKRFTVWLRSQDSGAGHAPIPVISDARGEFEVEQVPAGRLRLETASQPRLQAGGIELRPGQARQLEVPLDWGERWMFGKVVDANGHPVVGAWVTLQWSRQHYDVASSSHRRAATDIEGFFTFSNLGARDYSATVQAPGFQTLRRSVAPGDEDLVIVLQTTAIAAAGGGQ